MRPERFTEQAQEAIVASQQLMMQQQENGRKAVLLNAVTLTL